MQDVLAWLKNGTYAAGVALYERLGSNGFLKKRFATGADEFNTAKLRQELQKIVDSSVQLAVGSVQPIIKSEIETPKSEINAEQQRLNALRYHQLNKQKVKLYTELNVLKNDSHHLPEGEDLRLCAVRILTVHRQITEIFAQLDYYQQYQRFPEDEPKPQREGISIDAEMQLLRQSISKAKSRLAKSTCRNREQTEKLKAEAEARLKVLVAERKGAK